VYPPCTSVSQFRPRRRWLYASRVTDTKGPRRLKRGALTSSPRRSHCLPCLIIVRLLGLPINPVSVRTKSEYKRDCAFHAREDYNDLFPVEMHVRKAVETILAIMGCAIVTLIVGLVLSGLGASGVVSMQITHALFWLAFGISIVAAPLATWLISPSWKHCLAAFAFTAILVGGGLWYLDSWLTLKKVEQDATNQAPPPPAHTTAPSPSVPIIKTSIPRHPAPAPKPTPQQTQQDNSVHLGEGAEIDQQSKGSCSPNIVGGSNTVNCGPIERHLDEDQKVALRKLVIPSSIKVTLTMTNEGDSQIYGEEIAHMLNLSPENVDLALMWSAPGAPQGVTVRIHDANEQETLKEFGDNLAKILGVQYGRDVRIPSGEVKIMVGRVPTK